MGFLSTKDLRKKRFSFRKKKNKEDVAAAGGGAATTTTKNGNKKAQTKTIQPVITSIPEDKATNLEPPGEDTPKTVAMVDEDHDEAADEFDTKDPPSKHEPKTFSTSNEPTSKDGEAESYTTILGQINVVEDLEENHHINQDSNEDAGTEIVVGGLASLQKDPEGNTTNDEQLYESMQSKSSSSDAPAAGTTTIATTQIPYNENEIVEIDNDEDEFPADEIRQSLSSPMSGSRSSSTNKNNNKNNNHDLKADPPTMSSKSIDLGDLGADDTVNKILGVFNLIPEDVRQKGAANIQNANRGLKKAAENIGKGIETACDPVCAPIPDGNKKGEKRGIKRNLSFYNDRFAIEFLDVSIFVVALCGGEFPFVALVIKEGPAHIFFSFFLCHQEILNVGFAVIHHVSTENGDWSGRSATLILRPGTCNTDQHLPPRIEWSSMGGGTQSHITTDSVSLLKIHSLQSNVGDDDDDDDPMNDTEDSDREELQCLFTLTKSDGSVVVFEAITPDETARLVTGIKNISSRFSEHIISGDERAFTEFYSQHDEADFQKLNPAEAMGLMSHDFIDSLL